MFHFVMAEDHSLCPFFN